jgi:hypothetical protein
LGVFPEGEVAMKTKLRFLVVVMAAVLVGLGVLNFSASADSKFERSSLAGLAGVHVVVEKMSPEIPIESLSKNALQKDIEAMIAAAGIRVLTKDQMLNTPGMPYLYISIGTARSGPVYAYHLQIELRQGAYLERDTKVAVTSATWNCTGMTGMVPETELNIVRTAIDDGINEFIKAYIAANPPVNDAVKN